MGQINYQLMHDVFHPQYVRLMKFHTHLFLLISSFLSPLYQSLTSTWFPRVLLGNIHMVVA